MFRNKHLPRFNKVCFCCPLRIGNIVLVYINLIITIAICFFYLALDYVKFFIRIFSHYKWSDWLHRVVRYKTIPLVLAILILAYCVAEICTSIVILIGLHQKKSGHILKYMYYAIFTTILIALSRIFDMENHIWYFEIGPDLVYYAFKVYYILSIRSHLKSIQEFKEAVMYIPDVGLICEDAKSNINDMDQDLQNLNNLKVLSNYDELNECEDAQSDNNGTLAKTCNI